MAKKAIIPIDDHNDGDVCTLYYSIRIKLSADSNWTDLENQFAEQVGSPAYWAITLRNLNDDVSYDYEITRHCCAGTTSIAATGTTITTP